MPKTFSVSDFNSDFEGVLLKYRKPIVSHLLGKMILQMAFDSTQLAKRCKLDAMQLNIEDLCRKFYEKTQSNEQNLDKKLDLLAEKLEQALTDGTFVTCVRVRYRRCPSTPTPRSRHHTPTPASQTSRLATEHSSHLAGGQ